MKRLTAPTLVALNLVLAGLLVAAFLAFPVVRNAEEELGIRSVPVHYVIIGGSR